MPKIEKSRLLVLTVFVLAVAVFSVIQLTTASPATPGVSHPYDEITLPAGGVVWPNMNADLLDGLDSSGLMGGINCTQVSNEVNTGFSNQCSVDVSCPAGYIGVSMGGWVTTPSHNTAEQKKSGYPLSGTLQDWRLYIQHDYISNPYTCTAYVICCAE